MIKIENLYKTYKTGTISVEALKNINLIVKEKEFVSIMGPSGSGKSTLMNILGCLDKPTEGVYELDEESVQKMNDNELAVIRNRKIGFIFQSFNLIPRINALKNVELPMIYAGISAKERKERAIKALEKVGLKERMNHNPSELSGGQRQRVAIARSLVNNPCLIFADEPTGNLDTKSGNEVMSIFQQLNKEGVTIIMVTHEPDIAMHTKRMIICRDGEIIQDKPVENQIIINKQEERL